MKKTFAIFMVMAMAVIMMPLAANAQTYTTRRVYRNGHWTTIRTYTRTNRITPRERTRLAHERNRFYKTERRVTRDGVVTPREARKLTRQARRYHRTVRRDRNN